MSNKQRHNMIAFRVTDEDLETIDTACEIIESEHPNQCSRADVYRKGGMDPAQLLTEHEPEE